MGTLIVDTPFGFSLDLSFWQNFLSMTRAEQYETIFVLAGWWILALAFFAIAMEIWKKHQQQEYMATWQWTILAVDVPAQFVQSPKAVEQVFTHLSGAQINYSVYERYFLGKVPKWFSFEIISIEGYIQFLIRTEIEFRDLVEAAIYAQYTEAEITEVEDYIDSAPDAFPNDTHDAQGVEFTLTENEVYPIRTYPHFEYNISKDVVFSDPMAAILENFSRIGPGENLWLQLVILPIDNSWKHEGIDLVKKIIAGKKEIKQSAAVAFLGDLPMAAAKTVFEAFNASADTDKKKPEKKKEEVPGKVSDLTPGNKMVVESIEEKISKIGFKSRMRVLYSAKKEFFRPNKCLQGTVGAMNQFYINNRNGFKAKGVGGAGKDFTGKNIISAFKQRKMKKCYRDKKLKPFDKPFILNIEELATVWHFPLPQVKTPLLQKADIKHGEPPINLPVENFEKPLRMKNVAQKEAEAAAIPPPPADLPYA
jgi:hypothetical protein